MKKHRNKSLDKTTSPTFRPVNPLPYIYHVTRAEHRLSIYEEGLLPSCKNDYKSPLLFANNLPGHCDLGDFWPLPIDWYDYRLPVIGDTAFMAFASGYDYWRIDTCKAGVQWFVDPYLEKDRSVYSLHQPASAYVCTMEKVPLRALDLMEYDMEGYDRFNQSFVGCHPQLVYSDFNRIIHYKRNRLRVKDFEKRVAA